MRNALYFGDIGMMLSLYIASWTSVFLSLNFMHDKEGICVDISRFLWWKNAKETCKRKRSRAIREMVIIAHAELGTATN